LATEPGFFSMTEAQKKEAKDGVFLWGGNPLFITHK
jgi:hypothetical protein